MSKPTTILSSSISARHPNKDIASPNQPPPPPLSGRLLLDCVGSSHSRADALPELNPQIAYSAHLPVAIASRCGACPAKCRSRSPSGSFTSGNNARFLVLHLGTREAARRSGEAHLADHGMFRQRARSSPSAVRQRHGQECHGTLDSPRTPNSPGNLYRFRDSHPP